MINSTRLQYENDSRTPFFPVKGIYRWIILFVIFTAAFAVRLHDIEVAPMYFNPIREYRSYKLARALYYESSASISPIDKAITEAAKPALLEPPILDYLTSYLYILFGGEHMIIPQLLSILFWFIAAVLLLKLTEDIAGPDAGLVAISFFLLLPFGVIASRSFQPDPLMIMMFVASIYAIYRYYMLPSKKGLAAICVLSALAVFVKPVCIFLISGAFIAMRIPSRNLRNILFGRDAIIFAMTLLLPTLLYYCYAIFATGFLMSQADSSFIPALYLKPFYWKGWFQLATSVMGVWTILLSVIGVLLVRAEIKRYFLVGLWVGYVVFGLVFTMHISTHDYYQLMFIPIAAISLGVLGSFVLKGLNWNNGLWRVAVWLVFAAGVLFAIRFSTWPLDKAAFNKSVTVYEEIGERINHDTNTIFLDKYFGDVLLYYGRFAGKDWPNKDNLDFNARVDKRSRLGKELLDKMISETSANYFIISSLDEIEGQEELKETLDNEYALVAETPDYIIYDLRKPKDNIEKPE